MNVTELSLTNFLCDFIDSIRIKLQLFTLISILPLFVTHLITPDMYNKQLSEWISSLVQTYMGKFREPTQ